MAFYWQVILSIFYIINNNNKNLSYLKKYDIIPQFCLLSITLVGENSSSFIGESGQEKHTFSLDGLILLSKPTRKKMK